MRVLFNQSSDDTELILQAIQESEARILEALGQLTNSTQEMVAVLCSMAGIEVTHESELQHSGTVDNGEMEAAPPAQKRRGGKGRKPKSR